ncbi:hypothetical protein H5125_08175 [Shewanella sp. SR44-4]|uniref:hypothetical protein n=1 Tax=Shewanella sp. SR44-4 TaxID=2760935 RepID=UPI00160309A8|nr:hypothetical protein [Shewanella sp. SR44-4]MBB1362125.1 hypothetical protein [Shewanella sp. SR44-4]
MTNKNQFNPNEQAMESVTKSLKMVLNASTLTDPERIIVLKDLLSAEDNRQEVKIKTMVMLSALSNIGKH